MKQARYQYWRYLSNELKVLKSLYTIKKSLKYSEDDCKRLFHTVPKCSYGFLIWNGLRGPVFQLVLTFQTNPSLVKAEQRETNLVLFSLCKTMLCTITLIRCANKGISTLHTHLFLGYGTDQIFFPLCDPLGELLHFSALVHLFALTINISEF